MRFRTGFEAAIERSCALKGGCDRGGSALKGLQSTKQRFQRFNVMSDSVCLPGSFWSFEIREIVRSLTVLTESARSAYDRAIFVRVAFILSHQALQTMTVLCSDAQFPCSLFPFFFLVGRGGNSCDFYKVPLSPRPMELYITLLSPSFCN